MYLGVAGVTFLEEAGYVGSESSKVRLFYLTDLFKINKEIYIHHVLLFSSLP